MMHGYTKLLVIVISVSVKQMSFLLSEGQKEVVLILTKHICASIIYLQIWYLKRHLQFLESK